MIQAGIVNTFVQSDQWLRKVKSPGSLKAAVLSEKKGESGTSIFQRQHCAASLDIHGHGVCNVESHTV